MRVLVLFVSVLFSISTAHAYDSGEIIVTGTVEPVTLAESGSSVTVISVEEIEERQPASMQELLQSVPSLSIANSGVNMASIGIRGADARHTMVLLDGVPVQDPSSPTSMSLWMLPPSMVERVEVVSGPASAMYGSGAMSGVINIITKKSAEGATVTAGAGSYGAFDFSGSASSRWLTIGGSHYREKGLSAQTDNDEKDPYDISSVYAKQNFEYGSYSHDFFAMYNHSNYAYDPGDAETTQDMYTLSFKPSYRVNKYWTASLGLGYIESARESTDDWGDASFRGITMYAGLDNKLRFLNDRAILSIGGKWTEDSAKTTYTNGKREAESYEVYINGTFKPTEEWNIFGGGRYAKVDGKEGSADKFVYSANTSYLISSANLTLRAGYGTAFKAPTLDNLYDTNFGNASLKYEESSIWELGFRHSMLDNMIVWGVTYFNSEYDDQIRFASPRFINIDSKSQGVELDMGLYFSIISINAAYTYADMDDEDTGGNKSQTLRRPENRVKLAVSIYPTEALSFTAEAIYTDGTNDQAFDPVFWTPIPVENDSFTLVNLYAMYKANENLIFNAQLLNLFDEDYTTVVGYRNKGLTLHGGVTYRF